VYAKEPVCARPGGEARAWASATTLILAHLDSLSTFGHRPTPTRFGRVLN
jgi:hypothetical protein